MITVSVYLYVNRSLIVSQTGPVVSGLFNNSIKYVRYVDDFKQGYKLLDLIMTGVNDHPYRHTLWLH